MFENYKIKKLQEKLIESYTVGENLEAVIEELSELKTELEIFKMFNSEGYHNGELTLSDLRAVCGNLLKEIEDVSAVIIKLRLLFNRTYEQRQASARAKRKIVRQLKKHLRGGK